jgi:threonine dehydrogenase-like Zn-dependent dehydrogenase
LACRRGRYNCCADLKVMGAHIPGGLAEFIAVPTERLFPIDDVPAEVAVLAEPVSIGLQAITRAGVVAGDTVVVIGAGPIGLFTALAAADRGARVLVADRIGQRLVHARRLGADLTVDTGVEDLARATAGFTGDDGAVVVVEATGVPALIRLAVEIVAHSGTVVVVGISGEEVALPVIDFSRKELNLLGSRNNTGLFGDALKLVTRHASRIASMVTQIYPLDEVPQAIEYARSHPEEVVKVAIRL